MPAVTAIPLTVTPEAADYIDSTLRLRPEFERMLDYIRRNVKGLGSLQVELQPPYELGDEPVVIILALLRELIPGDTTGANFGDWQLTQFPYQVHKHFVMFRDLEPGHARQVFLEIAREILPGGTEVHWRGAAGRAYYALMLECRDALSRWGFPQPAHASAHHFVKPRFTAPADVNLNLIGKRLERLASLRNKADYDLASAPPFSAEAEAAEAIRDAEYGLLLLDHVDSDPALLAAAVAAIRAAFP